MSAPDHLEVEKISKVGLVLVELHQQLNLHFHVYPDPWLETVIELT